MPRPTVPSLLVLFASAVALAGDPPPGTRGSNNGIPAGSKVGAGAGAMPKLDLPKPPAVTEDGGPGEVKTLPRIQVSPSPKLRPAE